MWHSSRQAGRQAGSSSPHAVLMVQHRVPGFKPRKNDGENALMHMNWQMSVVAAESGAQSQVCGNIKTQSRADM